MRLPPIAVACLLLSACRIDKVRSDDTTRGGVEPGPGIPACGISPQSRVSEDGLGLLRIGVSIEAIRGSCAIFDEQIGDSATGTLRVDLGQDTARVDVVKGTIRRFTLTHQAYRTADSLGVGTHIATLMRLREATAITDRDRLYAISPAYCGLRFMLLEPAPKAASARTESSLVDLRIKNHFKDYLYRDIRALTTERYEKGARKV
jgi:hypothetical protein